MNLARARLLCLLLITAFCSVVQVASAAPSAADRATAQALFEQALNLMEKGDAAAACPKLEESQRLDPGVGTLLYLADCYETLGRTASAWATFLDASYSAKDLGQKDREKLANQNAERLKPTLSKLILDVEAADTPGLAITSDGQPISAASFGSEIPVDPGPHNLTANAQGHSPWSSQVTIPSGPGVTHVRVPALEVLVEVNKPVPVAAAPVAAPVSQAPVSKEAKNDTGSKQKLWGWVAVGTGSAALVGGGLFALLAMADNGRADDQCRQDDPSLCGTHGVSLGESATRKANMASVLGGVGAALAITGAVLVFTASDSSDAGQGTARVGVLLGNEPRVWLQQTW